MHVSLFQHSQEHGTPDAVFPNNWFSTHPTGEAAGGVKQSTLVFYPLKCPNRCDRALGQHIKKALLLSVALQLWKGILATHILCGGSGNRLLLWSVVSLQEASKTAN